MNLPQNGSLPRGGGPGWGQGYKFQKTYAFAWFGKRSIVECHLMAGDYDFIIKMRVANLDEFHHIKTKYFNKDIGIKNIRSEVVLKTIKDTTELPL